jgi:hypothetical protein
MRGQKKWNLPIIDATYKQITLNNLSLDDYGLKESNEEISRSVAIGCIVFVMLFINLFHNQKNRFLKKDYLAQKSQVVFHLRKYFSIDIPFRNQRVLYR